MAGRIWTAGLGLALVGSGLAALWWCLEWSTWREVLGFLLSNPVFATVFLLVWLGPGGAVAAVACWRAARGRRGLSRLSGLAAAMVLACAAALVLGIRAYGQLFQGTDGTFEPVAPNVGVLPWVLGSPALLGGLWLLHRATRGIGQTAT